jgi:hypothetical protein
MYTLEKISVTDSGQPIHCHMEGEDVKNLCDNL